MCLSKVRYQIHKENRIKDIEESDNGDNGDIAKKRLKLTNDEIKELDQTEEIEAEGRNDL